MRVGLGVAPEAHTETTFSTKGTTMTYDDDLDYEVPQPDSPDEIARADAECEVERRVEAGDYLDPTLACAFRILDRDDSAPCPQEATDERVHNGIGLPACPYHLRHGGTLTNAGMVNYVRAQIARVNRDAADSARRLGIDPSEVGHLSFPTHCDSCGMRLFTGNTSGRCADCNEATLPFPWKQDRHTYTRTACPTCGTLCDGWCARCSKAVPR